MATVNVYEAIQQSYLANALYILAKHALFDSLLSEEKSAAELARETGLDESALHALLELAAACGYLKLAQGRFRTAKSGLLLTKRGGSWLRAYLLVWGEQLQPAFGHLDSYVTSGTNALHAALGAPIWDYYGQHPAQHALFVDFMAQVTDQVHIPAIVNSLNIGSAQTLLDVGGGTGSLMCSLLDAYPDRSGTVFDQPRNQTDAKARMHARGMASRCEFIGGNMFANVPGGADFYLIKHVLHDWDDENAARILSSIAQAMGVDATLVLIEGVMDTTSVGNHAPFLHARNIEQRVWTEGRVRDAGELATLCAAVGLDIIETVHTGLLDVSYLYCRKRR